MYVTFRQSFFFLNILSFFDNHTHLHLYVFFVYDKPHGILSLCIVPFGVVFYCNINPEDFNVDSPFAFGLPLLTVKKRESALVIGLPNNAYDGSSL